MISSANTPLNSTPTDSDFTVEHYRDLLRLAKKSYSFSGYTHVSWGKRFVLWRHDCDYSLDRALVLAEAEQDEGISATYFVNAHSEFYSPFERSQADVIKRIIGLGHDIGLHFDAAFYAIENEAQLEVKVRHEANLLARGLGVSPAAFSFHNPSALHLGFEAETYGGLLNCYSKRFRTEVPYVSDSNGYWRFRRLRDVLEKATDTCLQVLTHPGWWQDRSMPPRERIFRCAYGRAEVSMRLYDASLVAWGRENLAGATQSLRFLKSVNPELFELCDYLWNLRHFHNLFVELWRLHESQINRLCKVVLHRQWKVPAKEVNDFFSAPMLSVDGWRLFIGVVGKKWQQVSGVSEERQRRWVAVRNQLVHGRTSVEMQLLEQGCVYLCAVIESLAAWGNDQGIAYDGLAHLGSIGLPTQKTADGSLTEHLEEEAVGGIADFPRKRWNVFKETFLNAATHP